jgi:hypothetical protein
MLHGCCRSYSPFLPLPKVFQSFIVEIGSFSSLLITMSQNAIAQLSGLLAKAGELRDTLSNGERLQLMGMTAAFLGELERPDEAVFRMVSMTSKRTMVP